MMYGDYGEMYDRAQARRAARRAEEAKNPKIVNRWANASTHAVDAAVTMASGNHNAGRAARFASKAALETNPGLKQKVGEATRDVAHEGGIGVAGTAVAIFLGPFALVGALFDPKSYSDK